MIQILIYTSLSLEKKHCNKAMGIVEVGVKANDIGRLGSYRKK